MFSLTQAEAEASPSVVTGQLSSVGTPYTVVIDFGVTHSFVSRRVIDFGDGFVSQVWGDYRLQEEDGDF